MMINGRHKLRYDISNKLLYTILENSKFINNIKKGINGIANNSRALYSNTSLNLNILKDINNVDTINIILIRGTEEFYCN